MEKLHLAIAAAAVLTVVGVFAYRLVVKPKLPKDTSDAVREAAVLAFDVVESLALTTPGKLDEVLVGVVRSVLGLERGDPLDQLTSEEKRRAALGLAKHFLGRSLEQDDYPRVRGELARRAAAVKRAVGKASGSLSLQVAGPNTEQ